MSKYTIQPGTTFCPDKHEENYCPELFVHINPDGTRTYVIVDDYHGSATFTQVMLDELVVASHAGNSAGYGRDGDLLVIEGVNGSVRMSKEEFSSIHEFAIELAPELAPA